MRDICVLCRYWKPSLREKKKNSNARKTQTQKYQKQTREKDTCPGEQVVNWVVKKEAEEPNSYGPAATPRLLVDDVGCAGLMARENFLILCVQQRSPLSYWNGRNGAIVSLSLDLYWIYGCISWPDASGGQEAAKGTWGTSLAGSVLVWQTRDHEFNLPEPSFKKKSPQDGALVTLELGGFLGCDGQPA